MTAEPETPAERGAFARLLTRIGQPPDTAPGASQ